MSGNGYQLGLVSVSFRAHTPKEILEAMSGTGLSHIEWGSDIHAPYNDLRVLYEIADLQKKYGIKCSSYGTYFKLGEAPISDLEQYINAARVLGTDVLRVWCGSKSGSHMTPTERDALAFECRKAASLAQKRGVVICTECHKGTFTERAEDTVLLMNEVGSEHFKTYWQPFQWQSTEQNIMNAKAIAPYVMHVHVFYWKMDKRLPLIDAKEDWKSYLKHFSKPRTLLLEFMPDDKIVSLSREAAALKKIVGDL